MSREKYCITFVDYHSRFTKIYQLRTKDETKEMFIKYKAEVENQLNKKINRLRSDREYIVNMFSTFCVTPPNPLRLEALIPIKFWDETDKISPKTGHFPGLKPYKTCLQEKNHNGRSHNSTATRRSLQLDGSPTRSTHPSAYKRFTRRYTIINLQTTTPRQVIGSHGLTERLE